MSLSVTAMVTVMGMGMGIHYECVQAWAWGPVLSYTPLILWPCVSPLATMFGTRVYRLLWQVSLVAGLHLHAHSHVDCSVRTWLHLGISAPLPNLHGQICRFLMWMTELCLQLVL